MVSFEKCLFRQTEIQEDLLERERAGKRTAVKMEAVFNAEKGRWVLHLHGCFRELKEEKEKTFLNANGVTAWA